MAGEHAHRGDDVVHDDHRQRLAIGVGDFAFPEDCYGAVGDRGCGVFVPVGGFTWLGYEERSGRDFAGVGGDCLDMRFGVHRAIDAASGDIGELLQVESDHGSVD